MLKPTQCQSRGFRAPKDHQWWANQVFRIGERIERDVDGWRRSDLLSVPGR